MYYYSYMLTADTHVRLYDASLYYIIYIYTIIHKNYTFTYILKNIPIHDVQTDEREKIARPISKQRK